MPKKNQPTPVVDNIDDITPTVEGSPSEIEPEEVEENAHIISLLGKLITISTLVHQTMIEAEEYVQTGDVENAPKVMKNLANYLGILEHLEEIAPSKSFTETYAKVMETSAYVVGKFELTTQYLQTLTTKDVRDYSTSDLHAVAVARALISKQFGV